MILNNEEKIYTILGMLIYIKWDIENNRPTAESLIWLIEDMIRLLES